MRKQVFFTGTLLAIMFLLASTPAFAQGLKISNDEAQTIQTEIKSGTPIKEVLEKHNITMKQVRSALHRAGFQEGKHKLTNTQIATIASQLGLDAHQIQAEIESGKTLRQILIDHNITADQIRKVFDAHQKKNWSSKTKKHH